MKASIRALQKQKKSLLKKLRILKKKDRELIYSGSRNMKLSRFIMRILQKKALKNITIEERLAFVERLEKLRNKYKEKSNCFMEKKEEIEEIAEIEFEIKDIDRDIYMLKRNRNDSRNIFENKELLEKKRQKTS